MKIENSLLVAFDLFRIRFPMQHPVPASVAFRGLDLESAGGKGEQVGRNRLGFRVASPHTVAQLLAESFFGIRYGLPVFRNSQLKGKTGLQIRLIEARKCKMRSSRNEKGVHEIRTAIERSVTGAETDLDRIVFRRKLGAWDDDVIFDQPEM